MKFVLETNQESLADLAEILDELGADKLVVVVRVGSVQLSAVILD